MTPEELKESLVDMVTHAQTAQKALNKITKTLEELAKSDKVCQLIQTIPGLGSICSCRLRATVGDIKRFKSPKDFPAYYAIMDWCREALLLGTMREKEKLPIVETGL